MSEVMDRLLNADTFKRLKANSIVPGTITGIREDGVTVDIGAKSECLVPTSEFLQLDDMKVGDSIEVYVDRVESVDGRPVVSYSRAQQQKNWEIILEKCSEGTELAGVVKSKINGGLVIYIGVDAFCPASHVDVVAPKNLEQYIGQTVDVKIIKINRAHKNIVVSRRELIEDHRKQKRQEALSKLTVGCVCKGIVKNVTDFGAFIDLDGIDGFLHTSNISWERIAHPSDKLKVGDEVEVMVIEVDLEQERISVGMKQLQKNPWEHLDQQFPVGMTVHGTVSTVLDRGAYVQVAEGIEGFIKVSELSWTKRFHKASEMLHEGDEVDAKVMEVNKDTQTLLLSLRQLTQNPWDTVQYDYPKGARVKGTVCNLTPFGVFVKLAEGIDGMIHVSQMDWTHKVNKPSDLFKEGDEVEAVVLDVDTEKHQISLGVKQLTKDPWEDIETLYHVGKVVKNKVVKVIERGVFVGLEGGIDGFIPMAQMEDLQGKSLKATYKVGDEIEARIIKIDKKERRICLSTKALKYDDSRFSEEVKSLNAIPAGQELTSLSDAFDQVYHKDA